MSGHGNGEMELKTPVGGIRIGGRDLLLAATLLILGAGAIATQYVLMTNWRDQVIRGIDRALVHIDHRFELSEVDRRQMLGLLRAQVCTTAFLQQARGLADEMREKINEAWAEHCLGSDKRK